ncbi:OPSX-like protein, partial [Mya arenaria]
MFGITQISLLAAIAFDRFVIIVKPRGFAFSKKKAIAAVIVCYINGCLWALFPAVGWGSYQLEGIRVRCAINWRSQRVADVSFTMSALILAWMVPLFVIVYSYAGIFLKLQTEQKTRFRQSLKQRSSRVKRDRKMAVTVLLMIGAFLISWTPYSVVTLIVTFGKVEYVPTTVKNISSTNCQDFNYLEPDYICRETQFISKSAVRTGSMCSDSNKIHIAEKALHVDTSDET